MMSEGNYIVASECVALWVKLIRELDIKISELQENKLMLRELIEKHMGDKEELYDDEGTLLLSYKYGKPIMRFDAKWLKQDMPDIYDKFLTESPGNRTFLVKKVDANE